MRVAEVKVEKSLSVEESAVEYQRDADHPKVIPMDLPSSHQVTSGPMT